MMHPATELRRVSPEIGHGVFATERIPRGTVVWVLCQFDIVLTRSQVAALPTAYGPIIERYAYGDGAGRTIMCWDNGRFLNHSCDPSMLGLGGDYDIAARDIAPGEEITCDYGTLNLASPLACRCGAACCRGTISGEDLPRRAPKLDEQVAEVLRLAHDVDQPLLQFARDPARFWALVDGRVPLPSHRDYLPKPSP